MPDVSLPAEDTERKASPMFRALIAPFAWALFQVAKHGARWNEKHNPPGSPITLKSMSPDEHCDSLVRHIADAASGGPEELSHRIGIAWRGLAQLQEFGSRRQERAPAPSPQRFGVFYAGGTSTAFPDPYASEADARVDLAAAVPHLYGLPDSPYSIRSVP